MDLFKSYFFFKQGFSERQKIALVGNKIYATMAGFFLKHQTKCSGKFKYKPPVHSLLNCTTARCVIFSCPKTVDIDKMDLSNPAFYSCSKFHTIDVFVFIYRVTFLFIYNPLWMIHTWMNPAA